MKSGSCLEGKQNITLGKVKIAAFPTKHVRWQKSVGIIIKYNRKKLVYTGDIGSRQRLEELVKVCQGADLLITEASYKEKTLNHYTIEQVKELVQKAKVKKVLVVHMKPQYLKIAKRVCQKDPKFILGKDGQILKI